MKRVYLDHAATTPLLNVVKNTTIKQLDMFGNASSLHIEGRSAKEAIERARRQVAELIGARAEEIIFTSGGTESNNMVFNTFWGQRTVISAIEHPSVFEPFLHGAGKKMTYGNVVPVDGQGRVKFEMLDNIFSDKKIKPRPALVSVMLANNELGTLQDIKKIAGLAHKNEAYVHTDATQAIGKIPVNVDDLDVDYLTISAHKIGGPKGVGALYVRSGAPIKNLLRGGHQEDGRRPGTYNTLGITGLGEAAKYAKTTPEIYQTAIEPLKNQLRRGIVELIPNVTVDGDQTNCLPNIVNLSFAGVEGESITLSLDDVGIAVSTGSACATGDIKPSHVLMAIKANPELAHGSIRFSLGLNTTESDINYVLAKLPATIGQLRQISTVKIKGRK